MNRKKTRKQTPPKTAAPKPVTTQKRKIKPRIKVPRD